MSNSLLIGEKVTWSIGKETKLIVLRGLFIEHKTERFSSVLCYEQSGQRRRIELEVETILLKRDNE